MKKLLLLLALALTSCNTIHPNEERVEKLIFDYTEHMEVFENVETNDMGDFLYFGEITIGVEDNGETIIIATRYTKAKDCFAILGIVGGLFEDGSFIIDEIAIGTYSIKDDWGYGVALETASTLEELVTVDFNNYMEELKDLTYGDIKYAMNILSTRGY